MPLLHWIGCVFLLTNLRLAAEPNTSSAADRLRLLGLESSQFVAAIEARNPILIELFLQARTNINEASPEGRTPLFAAVASGQWELALRLLAAGADPRPADPQGRTALMAAIVQGREDVVQSLLARGANPAQSDALGHSALHYAIMARSLPLTRCFLDALPPTLTPCCTDHDLAEHMWETGDWALIETVLPRLPALPRWNPLSRHWLNQALLAQDRAKIRLLLSKHRSAPTPEGRKQPLLAYALLNGQRDLFQLLVDSGADPNCPLNTPADKSFFELIPASNPLRHYLAEEPGMTLLMLGAGLGRTNEVKFLLSRGAKPGTPTQSKYRLVALHFAAWAQSAETLQALISNAPKPEDLRIEISLNQQSARLIKAGVPILSTFISTGKAGFSTPVGRFVITDKHLDHLSTIYKVPMPFFMRLNCRDFGMHAGIAEQPFASHGCIRLPAETAKRLYREVPIGTLVQIVP